MMESIVAVEPVGNGKKRKVATSPQTTRTTVQRTEVQDSLLVSNEPSRPRRRTAKRTKVEQETDEETSARESDDGKDKPASSRLSNKMPAQGYDVDIRLKRKGGARDPAKKITNEVEIVGDEAKKGTKIANRTETSKTVTKDAKQKVGDQCEDKPKNTKTKSKPVKALRPIAERTQDIKLRVGAHVSIAGGVHNAITNVIHIGGNAFAMFMKNQRKWDNVGMDPEHAEFFVQWCKDHSIDAAECCLPHGSYLVNLAHPDPARKKQAYDSFLDDLTRCHKLGIRYYNFHPGNANATTHEEGIQIIAENLNRAHADPETGKVVTVLETMATLGNTIGGTFADLAAIINLVKDKSRVGVCLDTCHVFAAGYDLRSPEAYAETMRKFDEEIGLSYLKAFHVNDSKAPLSSYRDLHAQIGTGYLGLQSFHNLMNDKRFHGLPMVLETPTDVVGENGKKIEDKSVWAREIKMLESLVGMDIDSEEFTTLSTRLQEEGSAERVRVGSQVQRKAVKDTKPKKKRAIKKTESKEDGDVEE